jgi:hypothetical protein
MSSPTTTRTNDFHPYLQYLKIAMPLVLAVYIYTCSRVHAHTHSPLFPSHVSTAVSPATGHPAVSPHAWLQVSGYPKAFFGSCATSQGSAGRLTHLRINRWEIPCTHVVHVFPGTWDSPNFFLFLFLCLCLCLCLLSLSLCLSLSLSIYLYQSISISLYLYINLSIHLYLYISTLHLYLSISRSLYLSIILSPLSTLSTQKK